MNNILAKAKEYRDRYPDEYFKFLKDNENFYTEYSSFEKRMVAFYAFMCKKLAPVSN